MCKCLPIEKYSLTVSRLLICLRLASHTDNFTISSSGLARAYGLSLIWVTRYSTAGRGCSLRLLRYCCYRLPTQSLSFFAVVSFNRFRFLYAVFSVAPETLCYVLGVHFGASIRRGCVLFSYNIYKFCLSRLLARVSRVSVARICCFGSRVRSARFFRI